MKKSVKISFFLIVCLAGISIEAKTNELGPREKALQALKGKDYETVIRICQQELASEPENYEFNFILSQAHAYLKQWEKALSVLDKMLMLYPDNPELILFRSKVQSWKGNYDAAESGYQQLLDKNPTHVGAMIGRAEIASWKREYGKAVEKYLDILMLMPENADIHFRIGRVYQWSGNYQKAGEYYQKAVRLDPENAEFREALKNARPFFTQNFELRYRYQNEGFSDERKNYVDHQLAFCMKIPPGFGSLHLKYDQTHRFDRKDTQYGMELYPYLWKRAYGTIDLSYSPGAAHYPRTSYLFEVYQGILRSAEISAGFRKMNFENGPVSIYLGSAGFYAGNYFSFLRWYYTPEEEGVNFSWFMNVRRYFSRNSYLAAGYGRGSRPFDIITSEDVQVKRSWIFLAEGDWCFLNGIRLKIQFMHRSEEGGLKRSSIFVAAGYRW